MGWGFFDDVVSVVSAPVTFVSEVAVEAVEAVGEATIDAAEAVGEATIDAAEAVGDAAVVAGEGLDSAFSKDGLMTKLIEENVPGAGLVTAGIHAAAGNEEYAQLAAIRGVGTGISFAAGAVGSLGGPVGGVAGSVLGDMGQTVWESQMRGLVDPKLRDELQELSAGSLAMAGVTGLVGHGVGEGVGRVMSRSDALQDWVSHETVETIAGTGGSQILRYQRSMGRQLAADHLEASATGAVTHFPKEVLEDDIDAAAAAIDASLDAEVTGELTTAWLEVEALPSGTPVYTITPRGQRGLQPVSEEVTLAVVDGPVSVDYGASWTPEIETELAIDPDPFCYYPTVMPEDYEPIFESEGEQIDFVSTVMPPDFGEMPEGVELSEPLPGEGFESTVMPPDFGAMPEGVELSEPVRGARHHPDATEPAAAHEEAPDDLEYTSTVMPPDFGAMPEGVELSEPLPGEGFSEEHEHDVVDLTPDGVELSEPLPVDDGYAYESAVMPDDDGVVDLTPDEEPVDGDEELEGLV